ncbi:thaumatin-like protein 1b [Vicia villosa]|uniref:thaumatin-like protein 1b n=1 Tax=Vicia villosa TaxID=3911 RepID=UPI00273ACF45|nr:thaumatin-like protein 1b [Vicia villosa]
MSLGFICFTIFLSILFAYASGATVTIINGGDDTIWPAVYTEKGDTVNPTGIKLDSHQQYDLKVPDSWSGTIWARTGCTGDPNSDFYCEVGDCGTKKMECLDRKPEPPATQVKLNLVPKGGSSSYEVDMKDGFGVSVTVTPFETSCQKVMCIQNLDDDCPNWLAVYSSEGRKIGCKSPCFFTKEPKYCCTGEFASPQKCDNNQYTELLDNKCPDVVSNAFDGSHFTCSGGTSFFILFN